ncbi:MAG: amidase family protein [Burkholderiaceae bacterium]
MSDQGFELLETSIADFHGALRAGRTSCRALVDGYLDRIARYDASGPTLKAILAVDPQVRAQADAFDARFRESPDSVGPLHGVPVAMKDNVATVGMPTTGGALALQGAVARADATIVARLREAGALVFTKTNLHELAMSGTTVSSLGGQTLNPYDLCRTPGGSSGGTGCALAANLALVGIGTDTGQSVRSPASALALVGLRPTRGLISRHGVMATSLTQDEVGPLARRAEDAARVLEVIAGYDENDPQTAFCPPASARRYLEQLDDRAWKGARIGVLREYFGPDAVHAEVNRVLDGTMQRMQSLGASLVEVGIAGLDRLVTGVWSPSYEGEADFDAWLAVFCPDAPVRSLREVAADGRFDRSIESSLRRTLDSGGRNAAGYAAVFLMRDRLRRAVCDLMARHRLDAILYPHQRRLVVPVGEEQVERNGVLSNATGFPAITFPAGFSTPDAHAPIGVPIGVELLGREWSEARLLSFAHAFETAFELRRAPAGMP